jgi:hypothetical protein
MGSWRSDELGIDRDSAVIAAWPSYFRRWLVVLTSRGRVNHKMHCDVPRRRPHGSRVIVDGQLRISERDVQDCAHGYALRGLD